ncbi:MAG: hypothetical protein PSV40_17090, partial [Polaromonas sp.]|uniref:hypothetical protein n=1 Tax=Polaromonas sp. TaxID=1869339 RepID=UPI002487BD30
PTPSHPSHPFSRPRTDPSQSASSRSGPVSAPSSPHFSDGQLAQLERALSQFIGPLAKMIVEKEVARHTALETLVQALAAEIDRPADRASFLAVVKKL